MRYSVEDIYKFSGQYDEVVSVTFCYNSESFRSFSQYIIGQFIYEPDERRDLQKKITEENYVRTDRFVKFKLLQSDKPQKDKEFLKRTGFKASDIAIIEQFRNNLTNQYVSTDLRSLPEPIEIKVDTKKTDNDALCIYLYDQMLKDGYRLAPFEVEKYNAALLNKFGNSIPIKEYNKIFLDKDTGLIKPGIRYYQLSSKHKSKTGLSGTEQLEFDIIMEQRASERLRIVDKELEKASEKPKEIWIKYPEAINIVASFITYFEPIKLVLLKFPIWLDFERFIHIYFGHTKAAQLGERYKEKTPFQYSFKETRSLIETVLCLIKNEIEEHFKTKIGKKFTRVGSMAIYYNGDYYNIHIDADGRLMTFYKQTPKS